MKERNYKEHKKNRTRVFIIIILILFTLSSSIVFAEDFRKVYVTTNSSKYHAYGCDYLNGKPSIITVDKAVSYGFSPCKVCDPYGLATEFYHLDDNLYTYSLKDRIEDIIIPILLLFISWLIVNNILKTLLMRIVSEKDIVKKDYFLKFSDAVLKNRKNIIFNLLILILLYIFNLSFLYWIAFIYYIIVCLLEIFLIIVSFFEIIHSDNLITKNLWLVFFSKICCEISNIIMIFMTCGVIL